jgi:hypothetical protein
VGGLNGGVSPSDLLDMLAPTAGIQNTHVAVQLLKSRECCFALCFVPTGAWLWWNVVGSHIILKENSEAAKHEENVIAIDVCIYAKRDGAGQLKLWVSNGREGE